jgi:hypothetical protein
MNIYANAKMFSKSPSLIAVRTTVRGSQRYTYPNAIAEAGLIIC